MEISSVSDALKIESDNSCFRGHSKYNLSLIPSIHRSDKKLKVYQTIFFESFLLYSLKDDIDYSNTWNPIKLLAGCQHYKVPTRLLDWSNNILVSLYFACETEENKDGELFILNKSAYHELDFANFGKLRTEPLLINNSKEISNPRIDVQSGCFILWGNDTLNANERKAYTLEEYNSEKLTKNPVRRFKVLGESKRSILEELNENGINRESLYNPDGISSKIENYYLINKKISDIFTNVLTTMRTSNVLPGLVGAFAGCDNLLSLPEDPMNEFPELKRRIMQKIKDDIGRNELCYCCSGKKYKHCHWIGT